jgi:hypothetical protein
MSTNFNRALSFIGFINEAYVDEFGELKDFNFSIDDELATQWAERGEKGRDPKKGWKTLLIFEFEQLLKDFNVRNLNVEYSGEIANFSFNWENQSYLIIIDLEEKYSEVIRQDINKKGQVINLTQLYSGDFEEMMDYFLQSGIDFLDQL